MKCDICSCEYMPKELIRVGMLNLKGSEDDYICNRCKYELSKFARSLRAVALMGV